MTICSVDECNERVVGRGLCNTHYHWHYRHGSLPPLKPRAEGCSVEDCDRPHMARGWCQLHYQRWQAHGTTDDPKAPPTDLERFWAKVDKRGPDECWNWTGSRAGNYGTFRFDGTSRGPYRFSYSRFVGPIPDGLVIDHLCRNGMCVNPAHLEPVTASENERRKWGNKCKQGHEMTEENAYVRSDGRRHCKICQRERERRYKRRKAGLVDDL